jgi:hypothetical protein
MSQADDDALSALPAPRKRGLGTRDPCVVKRTILLTGRDEQAVVGIDHAA